MWGMKEETKREGRNNETKELETKPREMGVMGV